jgi:hypothetical protein
VEQLHLMSEALRTIAILACYLTAVLVLGLVDAALTLLLLRWSAKIKKDAITTEAVPTVLSDGTRVYRVGGGIKRWD